MKNETKLKYNNLNYSILDKQDRMFIESLKSSKNTILFNLKFVFSNTRMIFIILALYSIAMMMSIIFIPFWISGAMLQLITMIIPGLIILGTTGASVRNSTLYKNMQISGIRMRAFYMAQLITIIIIINFLSFILWSLVWFLGHFNIFLAGWKWEDAGKLNVNPLAHWTPVLIIYISTLTAFVVFATYFLIESITSNEKTYNLIVVSLFIIGVIFGGSLNSYFARPYDYSFYDWSNSGGISGTDYLKLGRGGSIYVTEDFYNSTNGLQDFYLTDNQNGIDASLSLFPTTIFIPTLFNPFYGVGEFTSTAVGKGMCQDFYWNLDANIFVVSDLNNLDTVINVLPQTTNEEISIWSWFTFGLKDGAWRWTLVLIQPYITIFLYIFLGKTFMVIKGNK